MVVLEREIPKVPMVKGHEAQSGTSSFMGSPVDIRASFKLDSSWRLFQQIIIKLVRNERKLLKEDLESHEILL